MVCAHAVVKFDNSAFLFVVSSSICFCALNFFFLFLSLLVFLYGFSNHSCFFFFFELSCVRRGGFVAFTSHVLKLQLFFRRSALPISAFCFFFISSFPLTFYVCLSFERSRHVRPSSRRSAGHRAAGFVQLSCNGGRNVYVDNGAAARRPLSTRSQPQWRAGVQAMRPRLPASFPPARSGTL